MRMKSPSNYLGQIKVIRENQSICWRPKAGTFGMVKEKKVRCQMDQWEIEKWVSCRDAFQSESSNIKKFLFVQGLNKGLNVIAFIDKVEMILNVIPSTFMGITQRKDVIWVEPSSWWTKSGMRRSLFTILLRAGRNYKRSKDNFKEALFSIEYTKDTRFAVERFFDGHTKYQGRATGWLNQFTSNRIVHFGKPDHNERVKQLLVKP